MDTFTGRTGSVPPPLFEGKAVLEGILSTDDLIASHRYHRASEPVQPLERQSVLAAARTGTTTEAIDELNLGRSTQMLIDLAIRLKAPSQSTARSWKSAIDQLLKVTGKLQFTEITAQDARLYRDQLLERVAESTTRTRLRYLKGLFSVAVQEAWIGTNPFEGVDLTHVKTIVKTKETRRLDKLEANLGTLPAKQQLLYWIMRFTGTHVNEAAGLMYEDIDLESGVISIRPNDLRPLQNQYRNRQLPIVEPLMDQLGTRLDSKSNGHIFLGQFSGEDGRWGTTLYWQARLGISPKDCRDAVATTLRDAEVSEDVIAAILGRRPNSAIGTNDVISLKTKREALNKLFSG